MFPTLESVIEAWVAGELNVGDRGPGVRAAQQRLLDSGFNPKGVDGWFGKNTEAAIQAAIAARAQSPASDKLVVTPGGPRFVAYDDAGGLDLRKAKKFGTRKTKPALLVLHWPAGVQDAKKLHRMLSTTDRDVSTHFAVDATGVYQYLPLSARAWHAGNVNAASIGIDICQSPEVEDFDAEKKLGKNAPKRKNPTKRGPAEILALDPTLAANTRWLVDALCAQFNIPKNAPRANGVVSHNVQFTDEASRKGWSGVVGHHHCSSNKWDIACWWDDLFAGTPLG